MFSFKYPVDPIIVPIPVRGRGRRVAESVQKERRSWWIFPEWYDMIVVLINGSGCFESSHKSWSWTTHPLNRQAKAIGMNVERKGEWIRGLNECASVDWICLCRGSGSGSLEVNGIHRRRPRWWVTRVDGGGGEGEGEVRLGLGRRNRTGTGKEVERIQPVGEWVSFNFAKIGLTGICASLFRNAYFTGR